MSPSADLHRRRSTYLASTMEPVRIDNDAALSQFIDIVDGLHDALLHEAVLLNPGYVAEDNSMWGDAEPANARIIFQSQFSDIVAVRLDLTRVSRFCFERHYALFELEADFVKGELALYPFGKRCSPESEIRAAQVAYTLLGKEWRGSQYKLTRTDETGNS